MNPGDRALERIIAELASAIAMTADPRLVELQQRAVAMRSAEQVAHMERAQGLAQRRERAIKYGWGGKRWR